MLFLTYINDLSEDSITNVELLADDTSLFLVVHDMNTSANDLNDDLSKINDWAIQRKMSFNPNPSKQAIFCRKRQNLNHDSIYFNTNFYNKSPLDTK